MSETVNQEEPYEEESIEEEEPKPSKIKKEKNPNRVKQVFKLAAIGQKAKEEKMRKKVQDEMVKPTTWIAVGAVFASVGFVGLYFSPLFNNTVDKEIYVQPVKEEKPKSRNYFD